MPLLYSVNQENISSPVNTPLLQDWSPKNSVINYLWSNAFSSQLTPQPIIMQVKDVFGNPDFAQFSEFRISRQQSVSGGNFVNQQIGISPALNLLSFTPITQIGLSYTITFNFINLNLQTLGVKRLFLYFVLEGKTAAGNWQLIENNTIEIRLNVTNDLVTFSPSVLNFQHTLNMALPSKNITINGATWSVKSRTYFVLSSLTPGVTITTETDIEGNQFYIASGTGLAVVKVTLGGFWDLVNPLEIINELQIQVIVNQAVVGVIPVNVVVALVSSLTALPQPLNFTAVKSIQEPEAMTLFVFSSNDLYTIEHSPWLIIDSSNRQALQVIPLPTQSMQAGSYDGFIKLKDTLSVPNIEVIISVKYNLDGFIVNPYLPNQKAFTLDPKFFEFSTTNPNTYFQLTANVRSFEFFTGQETNSEIKEKLPLFQQKAKINYGEFVHRVMARFSEPNQITQQYKPADFTLQLQEVSLDNGDIVREALLDNISFVAGLSYDNQNETRFLDFHDKPLKMSKKGSFIFNCLVDFNEYKLDFIKNNQSASLVSYYLGFSNGHILSKKISFAQYNPGDVVQVSLNKVGEDDENAARKTFHMLPEQRYSWEIIWENEFLLQSCLEFTGNLTVVSDFERRSASYFKNLVQILEYIEINKVSKVNINTGWILKSQIDDIESLLRSKQVWILFNNKNISLRPISKTMQNEDKERELFDYTIEFQINRNYEQETYSF
jgi:hypothetical protein